MNKVKRNTTANNNKRMPTKKDHSKSYGFLRLNTKGSEISIKRTMKAQLIAFLAIALVELIARSQGHGSAAFGVVAIIFLSAVVYSALNYGVKQALLTALLVLTYNTISLVGVVEAYDFTDRNFRRIALLLVVLPMMAIVVGRLKEKIDRLLEKERKARENAEESEARLRFMSESMPQKIFTIKSNGKTDYLNPQWAEYTGISLPLIKNGDWTKLIHPDDVEENKKLWKHSLKTGEPFTFEHRFRRHDGTYHWHLTRAQAMRDKEGNIIIWVGSSTDIHDIKSALEREQKLEKTTAKLTEQREQLIELNNAKDEFISLASHQLRTPATGVKQYIGMLIEGYAGDTTSEQKSFLQLAYESNERQITIINDLLKVAKVDAGKVILQPEETDIIALVKDVLDEQASKFAQREQAVVFQPKASKLLATVDKSNLRMVLENIIDNASKYTPSDKTIEIKVSKDKGAVKISVKDEGVGIDQKDMDKVFKKFSRIDNPLSVEVGGSGLGLYWAKKIIDLHGGTIKVESEAGKGSEFIVELSI